MGQPPVCGPFAGVSTREGGNTDLVGLFGGQFSSILGQLVLTLRWVMPAQCTRCPGSWGGKWTKAVAATGFAHTITKLKPGTYSVKVTVTTSQGSASATKAGIVLKK